MRLLQQFRSAGTCIALLSTGLFGLVGPVRRKSLALTSFPFKSRLSGRVFHRDGGFVRYSNGSVCDNAAVRIALIRKRDWMTCFAYNENEGLDTRFPMITIVDDSACLNGHFYCR